MIFHTPAAFGGRGFDSSMSTTASQLLKKIGSVKQSRHLFIPIASYCIVKWHRTRMSGLWTVNPRSSQSFWDMTKSNEHPNSHQTHWWTEMVADVPRKQRTMKRCLDRAGGGVDQFGRSQYVLATERYADSFPILGCSFWTVHQTRFFKFWYPAEG